MAKRKFTITERYGANDTDFTFDALSAELADEDGYCVLSGDWYHDKIHSQIDGFFVALEYFGEPYERRTVKVNDSTMEVDEVCL